MFVAVVHWRCGRSAAKTREMLVAWGKRRKTAAVFKEVLELTTAQYDAMFSAALKKQLAPLRKNLPLLAELARAKEPGGDAAVLALQKSIGLDPLSLAPYEELYMLLDRLGKKAEAYEVRRKAAALDQFDVKLSRELLGGAARFGATKDEVLRWGELGNHIAPLQAEQHLAFARELKRLGLTEKARFEAESALLLEPNNAEAKLLAKP